MAQPTRKTGRKDATPPLCAVGLCPICLAVTAMSDSRPELTEHLLIAGREMLLALRVLIDARLEAAERPRKLERLTIE